MMLSVLLWLSLIYGMRRGAMIPGADRNYAWPKCVAGFRWPGLQPGDRGAWRLHAGDFHGADWSIPVIKAPGYWMSFAAICGLLATSCYLYVVKVVAPQDTAR